MVPPPVSGRPEGGGARRCGSSTLCAPRCGHPVKAEMRPPPYGILRPQLPAQATWVLAASWAVGLHPAGLPTHIARRTRGDTQLLRKHSAPGSASGPDGGTVVTPVLAEDLPLPPWCAKPYLCGADRCPALGGTQHYESTCQVKRVLCSPDQRLRAGSQEKWLARLSLHQRVRAGGQRLQQRFQGEVGGWWP